MLRLSYTVIVCFVCMGRIIKKKKLHLNFHKTRTTGILGHKHLKAWAKDFWIQHKEKRLQIRICTSSVGLGGSKNVHILIQ